MTLCVPIFSLNRFKIFGFRGNIYLPALPTFPLFLLAFQVETFTAAYWQLSLLVSDPSSCSAASSPATLLLVAPPPRDLPFFMQPASSLATLLLAALPPRVRPFFLLRGLLDADPSSCCAASSIWSGNPHPTHTILLLSRPTCPTDGATPSTEITAPSSN